MFDVIVDNKIMDVRERARGGNFDSMIALAGFMQQGKYTRRNEQGALAIINYVLSHKELVPLPETIWNAICWKIHLVDNEARDHLTLELVRHMASHAPEEWDHDQMLNAIQWLKHRAEQRDSALEQ